MTSILRLRTATFAAALCMPPATSTAQIPPQVTSSGYAFAFPSSGPRLEVEPAIGARLTSLRLGSAEFLFVDRAGINWGTTFWPSPQSNWNWPPPEALDRAPYAGGPQGNLLVLSGSEDAGTRISFGKRISAESADTSFRLDFVVRNGSGAARMNAPWLVTRVLPGGLTFFAKGAGRGELVSQVKEVSGWLWFDHGTAVLPGGSPKYYGDGAGWMAHVDRNGVLLLEVFPDIAPAQAAPSHAEVEIYADPAGKYMEIEHQGAYASIPPGDSAAWTTRWFLRKLPVGAERKPGDPMLMAFVNELLKRAAVGLAPSQSDSRRSHAKLPKSVNVFRTEGPDSRSFDSRGKVIR